MYLAAINVRKICATLLYSLTSDFNGFWEIINLFSGPSDEIKIENGLNCTFLRDVSGYENALNISYEKTDIAELSLSQLFLGFFEFYAQFDYNSNSVCVISGNVISKNKRDRKYLDVKNPLGMISHKCH